MDCFDNVCEVAPTTPAHWPLLRVTGLKTYRLLGYMACTRCVDASCCYRSCASVCVCMCVGYDCQLCKNGWTNQGAKWDIDSCEPGKPCIKWGPDYPREGAMLRQAVTSDFPKLCRPAWDLAVILKYVTDSVTAETWRYVTWWNTWHELQWSRLRDFLSLHVERWSAIIPFFQKAAIPWFLKNRSIKNERILVIFGAQDLKETSSPVITNLYILPAKTLPLYLVKGR